MSKDFWFAFNIGDYTKDTPHLSQGEHGAYIGLILYYYGREKPIPHNKRYAIAYAHAEQEQCNVDTVLSEFFYRDGDVWRQGRIEEEIEKRIELREKRKNAAEIRWNKNDASALQVQTHLHQHLQLQKEKHLNDETGGQGGGFSIMKFLDEDVYEKCRTNAPGWDISKLASVFNDNVNSKRFECPKQPKKAFPQWCQTYTKGKPPN